jgi:predicted ATPase
MIGRTEQLEQIMRVIGALSTDGPAGGASLANVLFVTGEAGIGKSTLLAAVRHECTLLPQAPTVAVADCSTPLAGHDIGEVESLQPWGEIMAALVTARPERRNETTKLVGELALAWVKVIPVVGDVIESIADSTFILKDHLKKREQDQPASATNQQQIFQQYINFLGKLADRGPLVLMIDDVHWADTASTNLLFAAARQLHGRPVLFILAYRPDDAASSRGGEGHPLLHIRNELERYDLAVDIGVPRMTRDEVTELLRQRYASYEPNERFEAWLVRTSDGNALFISQFIHTLEEDGLVDRETGAARDGFESIRVPSSAQAVVKERIRRLSEDAREMLRYASVEGDTFTAAVLSRITELPQLKLLQRLRLLEETHRIIRSLGKQRIYARETSAFQFGHVLLHKAMYEDLGEEERELLHEAVLDVLKEEWETARSEGANIEGIAARLAAHARVLGQHRFAAEALVQGAMAAWSEYAAEETLRLLDDALASLAEAARAKGSKPSELARVRGQALLLRSAVLRTCARLAESLASAEEAERAFEEAGDASSLVEALNARARTLRQQENHDAAQEAATRALESARASGNDEGAAEALATLGHLAMNRAHFDEALALYRECLALAETGGMRSRVAAALNNIGSAYDSLGEYASARENYQRSLDVLGTLDDRVGGAHALMNMGVLDIRFGEYDAAKDLLARALEVFRSIGDVLNENAILVNLGITTLQEGDWESSRRFSEQALAIARRIGDRRSEASALSNLGEVFLATDDMPAAHERFTQVLAIHEEIHDREGITIACINLADVFSKSGRADEAREQAERARETASAIGSRFLEAMAIGHLGFADVVALGAASGDERERLQLSASARLRQSVQALSEMGSPYAETWQQMLDELTTGAEP